MAFRGKQMRGDGLDKWYTPNEAAAYLRVSRATVYGLMRSGDLPYYVVGKRRRIHGTELYRYIRQLPCTPKGGDRGK